MSDSLFRVGSYYTAIDYYKELYDLKPNASYIIYQLGRSHELARDYKSALKWYRETYNVARDEFPQAQYDVARMLKMNGYYKEAKHIFEKISKEYVGPNQKEIKRTARNETETCDFAIRSRSQPIKISVKNLGNTVNKAYSEFAPMLWNEQLIFTSIRSDSIIIHKKEGNPEALGRLFASEKTGADWSEPELLNMECACEGMHVGNATLAPDGERMYLTKCTETETGRVICAIYESQYNHLRKVWEKPQKLGTDVNMPGYTSTQPAIAPYKDETEILYFVSDRPEGKGGLDIWYKIIRSERTEKVRNAGRKINSESDEMSPFYEKASGTFYFSSTGHPGVGGFDIFKTKGALRRWKEPENLGFPINSSYDDMYYTPVGDGNEGFLVSNRKGTVSAFGETCCDDIFSFRNLNAVKLEVKGNIYDQDSATIKDTSIVSLYSVIEDSVREEIFIRMDTIIGGSFYHFTLKSDEHYKIQVNCETDSFVASGHTYLKTKLNEPDTITSNIFVQKYEKNKGYRLNNIYFEFEKIVLDTIAKKTLDSLFNFLQSNPQNIIEISAHTDNKGDDQYNLELSQKRADAVVDYLIKKGIHKERLKAVGYGETRPITPNENPDGSDNEEGRILNRRIEFRVIGKLP